MRRILLDDRDNQRKDGAEHFAIGGSEDDWILSDGRGFLGTDGVSFGLRIPGEGVWTGNYETARDLFPGEAIRLDKGRRLDFLGGPRAGVELLERCC